MYKKLGCVLLLFLIILIFPSCSPTTRIAKTKYKYIPSNSMSIKVLLNEKGFNLSYKVENPVILYRADKALAIVKNRNTLNFSVEGKGLILKIADSIFEAAYFQIKPVDEENPVSYNGKSYRGILKVVKNGNTIRIINQLPLEDYLKGVVPAEMPAGKNDSYLDALKAFAICARSYAINKMNSKNEVFDIYPDSRDQVYGGEDAELDMASRAVDETSGMILTYGGKIAKVFFHASCGGHTENAKYVFGPKNIPYLEGVQDGDPPNCSIAANFLWEEKYTENVFIERLKAFTFTGDNDFSLKDVEVKDRDESGRVSLLVITLLSIDGVEKIIDLEGSKIRSTIRTADNSAILKSTMFNVSVDDNKTVTISGRGNGHGVGLCQWGAIHQSIEGQSYKDILSFYFPGTELNRVK